MDEWIRGKKPIHLRWIDPFDAISNGSIPEEALNRWARTIGSDSVKLPEPVELEAVGSDDLSLGEQALVSNYRTLASVPRLATRRFVTAGDLRLVRVLYDHLFLGLGRR
jgi:hypothetical protein